MSLGNRSFFIKVGLFIFGMATVVLYLFFNHASHLYINEVSFSSQGAGDWIEIYNPSFNTRSLKGMYLTDDLLDLMRYDITDDIVVLPQGFAIFYGEDEEVTDADDPTRLNFSIKNGETIYLIDENEEIVDSFTVVASDAEDVQTIGRFPDGSDDIFLMTKATLGQSNMKSNDMRINE